jgi:hypothetical protein
VSTQVPGTSPFGPGWSAPGQDTQTWEPAADAERRSFPIPNTWGPGARAGTARITNGTRGVVYVLAGSGTRPEVGNYLQAVASYQSVTVAIDADGLAALWRGTPGSAGGEAQRVTVEFNQAPPGAPTSAAIAEPTFPANQAAAWFPDPLGEDGELGRFRDPTLLFNPAGTAPPGETIVACAIENRTTFRLICRLGSSSGPLIAEIEPMTSSTVLVGDPILYVSTKGPNMNRGGGDQYVQFTALDAVPRLDPSASYPLAGIHEPAGVLLQQALAGSYAGPFGTPMTLLTIPTGKQFVVNYASIHGYMTGAGALGGLDAALDVTLGVDGASAPRRILMDAVVVDAGAAPAHSGGRFGADLTGPLILSSPGPVANTVTFTCTAGGVVVRGGAAYYTLSGWFVPDIQ